uniref:T-complex protein 11 homolog n=1 Tax=Chlorocebus sabaeus TaxID=60711 RepID=A0A0D9RC01_CHLSB
MNCDYYMEEKVLPPSSLEGKVKETVHNAFWDHLKEQLSATPPDFSCALELLKEIKEVSDLPFVNVKFLDISSSLECQ